MFVQTSAQSPFTFGGPLRRLADVNQSAFEVQGIDATGLRSCAVCQRKERACLQFLNYLSANAAVKVKVEMVGIVGSVWHGDEILSKQPGKFKLRHYASPAVVAGNPET